MPGRRSVRERRTQCLARISHTASAASCRLRRPAGCSASRLSPLRSGCCGPPPLRSGPNFPWTVCSHTVRREPPGGKSGPRVDAGGTLRATLRVVCLRLTSLCSVYLRYAPIRSGCGDSSSLRLATKRYEKSGLATRLQRARRNEIQGSSARFPALQEDHCGTRRLRTLQSASGVSPLPGAQAGRGM